MVVAHGLYTTMVITAPLWPHRMRSGHNPGPKTKMVKPFFGCPLQVAQLRGVTSLWGKHASWISNFLPAVLPNGPLGRGWHSSGLGGIRGLISKASEALKPLALICWITNHPAGGGENIFCQTGIVSGLWKCGLSLAAGQKLVCDGRLEDTSQPTH